MRRTEALRILSQHRGEIEHRFGVRALYLFGSVARDIARPESDVDVLVEFVGPADFDRFMGLKLHLEDLLGARVDLVTRAAIRPHMLSTIVADAIHVP